MTTSVTTKSPRTSITSVSSIRDDDRVSLVSNNNSHNPLPLVST
jgi:hypothetical protein